MKRRSLSIFAIGAALSAMVLHASAHPGAHEHTPTTKDKTVSETGISHVKMGAAVGFSHSELGRIEPNQEGRVTIFVSEAYPDGEMSVTFRGSEGLEVFGAERSSNLDLSVEGPHEVSVSYSSETEGDFRIGVTVAVDLAGGQRMGRAYAIPVRIGKGGDVSVAQKGSVQSDLTGERRIVFQAVETIR